MLGGGGDRFVHPNLSLSRLLRAWTVTLIEKFEREFLEHELFLFCGLLIR